MRPDRTVSRAVLLSSSGRLQRRQAKEVRGSNRPAQLSIAIKRLVRAVATAQAQDRAARFRSKLRKVAARAGVSAYTGRRQSGRGKLPEIAWRLRPAPGRSRTLDVG